MARGFVGRVGVELKLCLRLHTGIWKSLAAKMEWLKREYLWPCRMNMQSGQQKLASHKREHVFPHKYWFAAHRQRSGGVR